MIFNHILHNTDNKKIKAYNRLITKKPTGGNLQQKIEAQKAWKAKCQALLNEIRQEVQS